MGLQLLALVNNSLLCAFIPLIKFSTLSRQVLMMGWTRSAAI
jgi:hypothetical protein